MGSWSGLAAGLVAAGRHLRPAESAPSPAALVPLGDLVGISLYKRTPLETEVAPKPRRLSLGPRTTYAPRAGAGRPPNRSFKLAATGFAVALFSPLGPRQVRDRIQLIGQRPESTRTRNGRSAAASPLTAGHGNH